MLFLVLETFTTCAFSNTQSYTLCWQFHSYLTHCGALNLHVWCFWDIKVHIDAMSCFLKWIYNRWRAYLLNMPNYQTTGVSLVFLIFCGMSFHLTFFRLSTCSARSNHVLWYFVPVVIGNFVMIVTCVSPNKVHCFSHISELDTQCSFVTIWSGTHYNITVSPLLLQIELCVCVCVGTSSNVIDT